MAFHDVRLDEGLERGARGGPLFKTTVIGFGSGSEQRNQEWQFARGQWDAGYGIQNKADYTLLIEFFAARRGMLHSFRFKDWSDFEAARQTIGTGDGVEVNYQLIKSYTDTASTYVKNITRQIDSTLSLWVNGVLQTITTHYTIGPLGVITFVTAPPDTELVEAQFEFDLPVRFDIDKLDLEVEWYNAAALPDITIVELRE